MKTINILFFFLLIFILLKAQLIPPIISLPQQQNYHKNNFPFQRTIWTYWNSPDGLIPLVVQICFDNIQKVAKQHNFTFICVNQSTVRNYITNYDQQFLQVRKHSVQPSMAHAADLLRVLLIQQQGGIWVDSTTIFLNGLSELQNIMSDKYAHMIVNRFSPQPDALLFYYSQGQNRIQHWVQDPRNGSRKILYNQYPDYEIWAIMAKKNCSFMRDLKQVYTNWTQTDFKIVEHKLIDQDIYMNRVDDFSNYLYLNMAVTYMLQRKQIELDSSLNMVGTRFTSFQYYKLWGLHAEYGPMLTTREDLFPISDVFIYSKEQIQQKGFNFLFFMKQFGFFRYVTNLAFNVLINFQQKNITFANFLASNPDGKWCQNVTWLVKGSIMYQMVKNSKISKKHSFIQISSEQNQKWEQYCDQNGSLIYLGKTLLIKSHLMTIIISLFMPDKIHKSKVQSILNKNKNLTFIEQLKVIYDDNAFLMVEFGYLLVIFGVIYLTYKTFIKKFQIFIKKQCNQTQIYPLKQFQKQQRVSILPTIQIQKKRKVTLPINSNFSQKNIISYLIYVMFILSLMMYNAIDILGGQDQLGTIFLCVGVIFIMQSYIEHKINNDKQFIAIKYKYELFYIISNFMIAYLGLCHIRRNRFWLNWFSLVIGLVGPCILKLKKQIQQIVINNKQKNKNQQNKWAFLSLKQNIFRYMILGFLLILLIFPNIKFMSDQNGYYIKYIPIIIVVYLIALSIQLIIISLCHMLWLQIIRLLIIWAICIQYPTMINHIDSIIHSHARVLFIFRKVIVLSVIYLSIGTQIRFKNVQERFFNKSLGGKFVVYLGLVIYQMFFGRFIFHRNFILWNQFDFTEHWCIFVYGVFMVTLLTQLQKIKQQQIQKQKQKNYLEEEADSLIT